MIATDARTRRVPLMVGGAAAGSVLAVLARVPDGGGAPAALAAALPFLLAALTGVAKTTTA